jgi:hypothetical protein
MCNNEESMKTENEGEINLNDRFLFRFVIRLMIKTKTATSSNFRNVLHIFDHV